MRKLALAARVSLATSAPATARADLLAFTLDLSLGLPWQRSRSIQRAPTNIMLTPGLVAASRVSAELAAFAEHAQPSRWAVRPMIGLYPPILPLHAKLVVDVNNLNQAGGLGTVTAVGGALGQNLQVSEGRAGLGLKLWVRPEPEGKRRSEPSDPKFPGLLAFSGRGHEGRAAAEGAAVESLEEKRPNRQIQEVSQKLLTSAEVAQMLGVTAGSVKRWADLGLIQCARTAGRHRRFTSEEVDRFRRERSTTSPGPARLLDRLLSDCDTHQVLADLYGERARLGSWWKVAESLVPLLVEIGERWAGGSLSILEEHVATERLSRAISRIADELPARSGAPRVLLATAEGEEHTLGLSLVELVVREWGWQGVWAGRRTPLAEVVAHVAGGTVDAVAVSASEVCAAGDLLAQTERLGAICRAGDVALVLGGCGPWPEWIPYGARVHTFEELRGWLQLVESGSGRTGEDLTQ
jgi:excisionase family DNA binding protein